MNYGKQRAPLVECKRHGEFRPADEFCRWCTHDAPEPAKSTWDEMVLDFGIYCGYCQVNTKPLGNGDCSKCWGAYNP